MVEEPANLPIQGRTDSPKAISYLLMRLAPVSKHSTRLPIHYSGRPSYGARRYNTKSEGAHQPRSAERDVIALGFQSTRPPDAAKYHRFDTAIRYFWRPQESTAMLRQITKISCPKPKTDSFDVLSLNALISTAPPLWRLPLPT